MAKLCAHGHEIARYFSIKFGMLLSVRSDGVTLGRGIGGHWKVVLRRKADVPLDEWRGNKIAAIARVPAWQRDVKSLPSFDTLREWESNGKCETPTGHTVEPDGIGPDGVPSWLVALRWI